MTTTISSYKTIAPWVPFMFSPNKLNILIGHQLESDTNNNNNNSNNNSIPEKHKSGTINKCNNSNNSKTNSIPEIYNSDTTNKCNSHSNNSKTNSIPEKHKSDTNKSNNNSNNSTIPVKHKSDINTNKCNNNSNNSTIPEKHKSDINIIKCNNKSNNSTISEKHKSDTNEYFVYNVVDSLFWLLFIGAYGVDEYNVVEYNFGKRIIEQKQQLIQMVSTMPNKQIRELTGRKLTIQSVRDILASIQTSQRITTDAFPLFALYHNTDIFIFDRVYGTYCEYEYKNATTIPIILYKQGNTFSVERTPMKCIEADYATRYIRVNEPGGCIEPITHYTKPQLVAMLTTLQQYHNPIPPIIVVDCNKKELYDHILRFIGHSSVLL